MIDIIYMLDSNWYKLLYFSYIYGNKNNIRFNFYFYNRRVMNIIDNVHSYIIS